MHPTILMIEDEPAIREMVAIALGAAGFHIEPAGDVASAEILLAKQLPTLILLDLMLPDVHGLDFTRRLKDDPYTRDTPLIMLTAKADESSKIKGLNLGADDYVTKPFSPKELIARIRAVIRRSAGEKPHRLSMGTLHLDNTAHRLSINEQAINIGPTEFRLLRFLLSHRNCVFSRSQLLDRVWGRNQFIDERTVDVHIRRLRKSLAPYDYDRYIQTVRGAGYCLSEQV